jgi:hypothetical protein
MPHLYAVEMIIPDYFNPIKIGFSVVPDKRAWSYSSGPFPTRWLGSWPVDGRAEEPKIHRMFDRYRLKGEWFYPAPFILDYVNLQLGRPGSSRATETELKRNELRFSLHSLARIASWIEGHPNPLRDWDDPEVEMLTRFFDKSEASTEALKSSWRW